MTDKAMRDALREHGIIIGDLRGPVELDGQRWERTMFGRWRKSNATGGRLQIRASGNVTIRQGK